MNLLPHLQLHTTSAGSMWGDHKVYSPIKTPVSRPVDLSNITHTYADICSKCGIRTRPCLQLHASTVNTHTIPTRCAARFHTFVVHCFGGAPLLAGRRCEDYGGRPAAGKTLRPARNENPRRVNDELPLTWDDLQTHAAYTVHLDECVSRVRG